MLVINQRLIFSHCTYYRTTAAREVSFTQITNYSFEDCIECIEKNIECIKIFFSSLFSVQEFTKRPKNVNEFGKPGSALKRVELGNCILLDRIVTLILAPHW